MSIHIPLYIKYLSNSSICNMGTILFYGIIFLVLLALELVYFRVADRFNIIDKPNERSSHSSIVLRGGGIIFLLGVLVWAVTVLSGGFGDGHQVYPWFLLAVMLAAGISFVDDIRSLPDSGTFGCVVPVGDWNLSI